MANSSEVFLRLAAAAVLAAGFVTGASAQSGTAPLPDAPAVAPAQQTRSGDGTAVPSYPPYENAPQAPPAAAPQTINSVKPATADQKPVVADTPTAQHPNVARAGFDLNGDRVDPQDYWLGSTYIPMDSWMYPALLRLYGKGYLDTAFISLRPWTRRSVLHMLDISESDIRFDNDDEAIGILDRLYYELRDEPSGTGLTKRGLVYGLSSAYVGVRGVGGTVLRDSYHLGQTFNNDYGRPYSNGFNSYNGFSALSELGPFSLYVRAEVQHSPGYEGYSYALASQLSLVDGINYNNPKADYFGGTNRPQATVPEGPLPAVNRVHVLEATLSAHVFQHEISFGKSDAWLGPGLGGSMAWSNNAENMYNFRINRIEPLHIPYVSRVIGDIRYDFFIGSLKGHTYPNRPYAHSEKIDFAPTRNFQMGFQRTIIFGGKGHQPVNLHTFLKGFFDINDTTFAEKYSRNDPGARFSAFTFSYRLPFVRKYAMIYADSITHDDIFPISAPRRAGWRPGMYFSQLPYLPKMDLRVEGSYTDYVTTRSTLGQGVYYETIQRQGYTNNGFILGDWMGREAKGGQAWLTYHLSGNEWVTFQFQRKKNGSDFPIGGTTQTVFRLEAVKRLTRDVELNAWFQSERWKAPVWKAGQQGSTTGAFTLTWYPRLKSGQ